MANRKEVVNEDLEEDLIQDEEEDILDDEDSDEEEIDEEEVDEETDAASTLHPAARSMNDPKSKIEVMKSVIGAVASASDDDLTKWWTQAVSLIGHEGDKIPGGAAASNKASIDMKPSDAVKESVREDLKTLFAADKTLTEEARDRLETIFEAAVSARIMLEREELEEQYNVDLNEQVAEITEEIEEQLNNYLSYVTESWMEENEVAIESSLKSELTEEFMDGLRTLFAENFIDVPDSKTDIVEALTEKVEELENVLNGVIEENNELKGLTLQSELEEAIEEIAEGLTVSQAEKLAALVEDVDFDGDIEAFKKKVGIIKETYFTGGSMLSEEDDFERTDNELNENATVYTDPNMQRYAAKISQTAKEDLR